MKIQSTMMVTFLILQGTVALNASEVSTTMQGGEAEHSFDEAFVTLQKWCADRKAVHAGRGVSCFFWNRNTFSIAVIPSAGLLKNQKSFDFN